MPHPPRHLRFSHASRRIFARFFSRNRLTKVARLFARRCALLSEYHDHRIADASSLMRQQYSVTEDLKWPGSLRTGNRRSATP